MKGRGLGLKGGGLHARISFFIIIFLLKTGNGCDV